MIHALKSGNIHMFKRGDILLVKDKESEEHALLIKVNEEKNEYVTMTIRPTISPITLEGGMYIIDEKTTYFENTGLNESSFVQINKLNYLTEDNILKFIGKVPENVVIEIKEFFINYLLKDGSSDIETEFRTIICGLTREFFKNTYTKKEFRPGNTYINYAGRVYDEKEIIALVNSSLDFWLTAGKYAKMFEKGLSDFLNIKYCSLTNSGSSANLLAISALTSPKLEKDRLEVGDEVITIACGFPTTVNPIIQNNLIPVFIDINLETYNIQVDKIEDAISEKTKAIFIPHTLGNPVEIDRILEIAENYDLWFIEDNCDALGSKYKGKYTGSFGHISTCSFYPAHHITTGEGGAVLTNDPLLRNIITSFRDWGRDCWCDPGCDNTCGKRFNLKKGSLPFGYDHKYIYSHIGYNLKITDMQAAIGVEQMKKLPFFIEKRKSNFKALYEGLKRFERYYILPYQTLHSDPCWFGFPILVKDTAPFTRDDLAKKLEENKIATRMLFGGNLTKQPAYEDVKYRIAHPLVNTDLVMSNLLWIGVYPGLTQEMIQYIIQNICSFSNTS